MNKRKYKNDEERKAALKELRRELYHALKESREAAGTCIRCGKEKEPSRAGKTLCFKCGLEQAKRTEKWRARKALDKTE